MALSIGTFVILVGFAAMEVWVSFTNAVLSDDMIEALITIEGYHPLLLLGTAVAFLIWSYKAHANLDVFERQDQTHVNQATLWWWIVPVALLWMPFRVVFETVRGSTAPRNAEDWKQEKLMPIAIWWTVLFLASFFAINFSASMIDSAFTFEDLEFAIQMNGFAFLIYGAGAVFAAALVWQVTKAQTELAASWVEVSMPTPVPVIDAPVTSPKHQILASFCSSCGHQFGDTDTFCSSCGSPRPA